MNLGLFRALALALTLAATAAAHAEDVTMTFGGAAMGSFTFDSTQYTLTSGTFAYPGSAVSSANIGTGTVTDFSFAQTPDASTPSFTLEAAVSFGGYVQEYFYGDAVAGSGSAPVFTPGVYHFDHADVYFDGMFNGAYPASTATVSFGTTPEPSSFLLLGTGLFAVGGAFRRRLAQ